MNNTEQGILTEPYETTVTEVDEYSPSPVAWLMVAFGLAGCTVLGAVAFWIWTL